MNGVNTTDDFWKDGIGSTLDDVFNITESMAEYEAEQEAEKVSKFKSIDFKPNRLVGFVRSENSYHSIPPRVLPNGVTRDCFQINVWNLRSRKK